MVDRKEGWHTLMARPASSKPFMALSAASADFTSTYSMKQKPLCRPVELSWDISTSLSAPKFANIDLCIHARRTGTAARHADRTARTQMPRGKRSGGGQLLFVAGPLTATRKGRNSSVTTRGFGSHTLRWFSLRYYCGEQHPTENPGSMSPRNVHGVAQALDR